jgi:fido (protein-threonine AMPylation protein)
MNTRLSPEQLKLVNRRCAAEAGCGDWDGVVMEFGRYEIQTEPEDLGTRKCCWDTAIGLQRTDGLTPSGRLLEIARANAEGRITIAEAERLVKEHYSARPGTGGAGDRTKEADHAALRITRILEENTYSLAPSTLASIHRRVFGDVFPSAGRFRAVNLSKPERALGGRSAAYADFREIRDALDRAFSEERVIDYSVIDPRERAKGTAGFISTLWRIHPFREGNTRTIAVFAIQRLRFFGFDIAYGVFRDHALDFRDSLARASRPDTGPGVLPDRGLLDRFFGNLLFGDGNRLNDREPQLTPPASPASPAAWPPSPDRPAAGAGAGSGPGNGSEP